MSSNVTPSDKISKLRATLGLISFILILVGAFGFIVGFVNLISRTDLLGSNKGAEIINDSMLDVYEGGTLRISSDSAFVVTDVKLGLSISQMEKDSVTGKYVLAKFDVLKDSTLKFTSVNHSNLYVYVERGGLQSLTTFIYNVVFTLVSGILALIALKGLDTAVKI